VILIIFNQIQKLIRDGPFSIQRGGGGGGAMGFFLEKYSDSQCMLNKYSDFGGGKKIT
jgi:hypothetical protein